MWLLLIGTSPVLVDVVTVAEVVVDETAVSVATGVVTVVLLEDDEVVDEVVSGVGVGAGVVLGAGVGSFVTGIPELGGVAGPVSLRTGVRVGDCWAVAVATLPSVSATARPI